MIKLESESQFNSLKKENTVFEFTAGWCPDCRIIEPDLPRLEEKYNHFNFVSVDRDEFIDLAIEMILWVSQAFLVYKNDELVGSYIEKNENLLNKLMNSWVNMFN